MLTALIDGDILLYEIGFGAETGWKKWTNDEDAIPPFWYVEDMLMMRLENIKAIVKADTYEVFVTYGDTFRINIAKTKPYKGTRKESKPWHYANLKAYIKGVLGGVCVTEIEADDYIGIVHSSNTEETIICSRDKDLKQIPGQLYSWELGKQPQFGPCKIDRVGTLAISDDNKKLSGTGLLFFYAQMLVGDVVDNIPGLPKCGPVAAYKLLTDEDERPLLKRVSDAYEKHYGEGWEDKMIEQGQLCWIVRRYREDGTPEIWFPGLEE